MLFDYNHIKILRNVVFKWKILRTPHGRCWSPTTLNLSVGLPVCQSLFIIFVICVILANAKTPNIVRHEGNICHALYEVYI